VRSVDAAVASGDPNAIITLGGRGGEIPMALQGHRAIRGTLIDLALKERIAQAGIRVGVTPTRRLSGMSNYGADVWSLRTRRAWDSTTPRQWNKHVRQYVTSPPPGRPVWRSLSPLFTNLVPLQSLWGLAGVSASEADDVLEEQRR
jgi:hypothetical protein